MLDQTNGQPSSASSGMVAKTSPETEIYTDSGNQQDKVTLLFKVSYCRGISLFHTLQEGHWGWWDLLGSFSLRASSAAADWSGPQPFFDCLPGQRPYNHVASFQCLITFPLIKWGLDIFWKFQHSHVAAKHSRACLCSCVQASVWVRAMFLMSSYTLLHIKVEQWSYKSFKTIENGFKTTAFITLIGILQDKSCILVYMVSGFSLSCS